jgi:hypothetical protein
MFEVEYADLNMFCILYRAHFLDFFQIDEGVCLAGEKTRKLLMSVMASFCPVSTRNSCENVIFKKLDCLKWSSGL